MIADHQKLALRMQCQAIYPVGVPGPRLAQHRHQILGLPIPTVICRNVLRSQSIQERSRISAKTNARKKPKNTDAKEATHVNFSDFAKNALVLALVAKHLAVPLDHHRASTPGG